MNDPPPFPNAVVSGLVPILKPSDWTSHDVVAYMRKTLEMDAKERQRRAAAAAADLPEDGEAAAKIKIKRPKIKVGHGGTLDPMATGVLVVGVGTGTKMLGGLLSGSKGYSALGRLGFETDTLDVTGETTLELPHDKVTYGAIEETLTAFRGDIMQVPPVYSALKKGGKRMADLARGGAKEEDLEIEPRQVTIHSLVLQEADGGLPNFGLDIACGGGTYVRSLIRDIARAAGSCASMTSLVRTRQGPFNLSDCIRHDSSAKEIYEKILECQHVVEEYYSEKN